MGVETILYRGRPESWREAGGRCAVGGKGGGREEGERGVDSFPAPPSCPSLDQPVFLL